MHKEFVLLPHRIMLPSVKAAAAPSTLKTSNHIPMRERTEERDRRREGEKKRREGEKKRREREGEKKERRREREREEGEKEKSNSPRNPVKKESCCKACTVQRAEVGSQWLLYFI